MFTITIEADGSVIAVIVRGHFDTVNSIQFNEKIQMLLEREDFLIIDLTGCRYLSSSGIRSLMTATRKLAVKGGRLMLSGVQAEVLHIIEISGLHKVFYLYDTLQSARDEYLLLKKDISPSLDYLIHNNNFQLQFLTKQNRQAFIWKEDDIAGYGELGISLGIGSPAESPAEDENNRGLFITIGNCSGFIPFNEELSSDFRVLQHAADGGIFVHRALSFGQNPGSLLRLTTPSTITLGQLADAVAVIQDKSGTDRIRAVCIAGYTADKASVLLAYFAAREEDDTEVSFLPEYLPAHTHTTYGGNRLTGAKFLLNELPPLLPDIPFTDYLHDALTLDNIEGIGPLDLFVGMATPAVWLFHAYRWVDSGFQRLKVETGSHFPFEPYKVFLTRRLYEDSARVTITQLHGGYSAQTFQVESFDNAGRKLRPTVLKIGSRPLITREADRCQRYALPYIMNNSAIVLGTAFYGNTGALRYNFVGIGGEKSHLKWLTHYFDIWPVGKLEPLFDKIFTQILKPWYGQPVRERIYPFRDHDPTRTFFPRLCETAEEVLGIPPDEMYFTAWEKGRKLVNPYWFLRREYKKRRNDGMDYFTAICHGDLNMQNILLDDELNVYLIDFSETGPRAVISDFARLEAIFMVEKAPLDNEGNMKEMTEFVTGFYSPGQLDILPDKTWTGKNREIMHRNIAMTLKMRQYAIDCVKGNGNIIPYFIAMLEWVLPIVCYTGVSLNNKKLSAVVAGLLCERLMAVFDSGTETS